MTRSTAISLIKINDRGDDDWTRAIATFEDAESTGDHFTPLSVYQTSDNGYIVGIHGVNIRGDLQDSPSLIKTNSRGEVEWSEQIWLEDRLFLVHSAIQTTDGDFVATGHAGFVFDARAAIVKTDAVGGVIWFDILDSGGENDDLSESVDDACGGDYVHAGVVDDQRGFLRRVEDGQPVWTRVFQEGELAWANGVCQTRDCGGYALAGYASRGERGIRGALLITDNDGRTLSSHTYGDFTGEFRSIEIARDGGYVLAGSYSGSAWLVRTDEEGRMLWSRTGGGFEASWAHQTRDGGYVVIMNDRVLKLAPDNPPELAFLRSDADSSGDVDLTDAVYTLNHLFSGGPAPGCADAADADDNGKLEITDAISTLNWLFRAGPEPPSPGPAECGLDETEDPLPDCSSAATRCT